VAFEQVQALIDFLPQAQFVAQEVQGADAATGNRPAPLSPFQNGCCGRSSSAGTAPPTGVLHPSGARFAACGYARVWDRFGSLEMPFFLGLVSLITSQQIEEGRAFRAFFFPPGVQITLA
jgi:hypothetical protein